MIAIIICCCYKYEKQFERISKYWDKIEKSDNTLKFFYLFGDKTISNAEYNETTRKLVLKNDDTYESLPKKIYEAIKYIYNTYANIDGIYKTDDDIVYDDLEKLVEEIKNCIKKYDYSGLKIDKTKGGIIKKKRLVKFTNTIENKKENSLSYDNATYCYGAGYALSNKAIKIYLLNKDYVNNQYLEDVCMGHILNMYDIYPNQMKSEYKEIKRII